MSRRVNATGTRTPTFRSLEERLWWARETAPLTQRELADMLGISKRTVQNYEAGVGHPTEQRLLLWANACDVDYRWLAGDFYGDPGPDNPSVSPGDTQQSLTAHRYRPSRSVADARLPLPLSA